MKYDPHRSSKPIKKDLRKEILISDNYRCAYCGKRLSGSSAKIDHIVSARYGGKTEYSNLITSCEPCNKFKSSKTIASFQKKIRVECQFLRIRLIYLLRLKKRVCENPHPKLLIALKTEEPRPDRKHQFSIWKTAKSYESHLNKLKNYPGKKMEDEK